MSVIIKGLDMPEKCAWCPMCYDFDENSYFCSGVDNAPIIEDIMVSRPEYCPLKEVKDEF